MIKLLTIFEFENYIMQQNSSLFMYWLTFHKHPNGWNYKYLIYIELLFNGDNIIFGLLNKKKTERNQLFCLIKKYYSQVDEVGMCPLFSPILSNIFQLLCESVSPQIIVLQNVPINSDHNITKDLWMISLYFLKNQVIYNNLLYMKIHLNIRFSVEAEKNGFLLFLGIKILRE